MPYQSAPDLQIALRDLTEGKCVAIPTETVYGLAADATNGEAVARIFETKGRPKFNPLICHVDGLEMANIHGDFDPVSLQLAEAFWPGPLTLVVPLNETSDIHPLVSAGLDTIALRQPKGIASQLISDFGKPLAAPSANRSGKVSPTSAAHVRQQLPDANLHILDTGACDLGLESTIAKVSGDHIVILRPGGVTSRMIEECTDLRVKHFEGDTIEAPGMMRSHYAPTAKLLLNCDQCPEGSAWLQFGNCPEVSAPYRNLSKNGELLEAAANLYGHLIELDQSGAGTICVSEIPNTGLGVAINDRLQRAAAPRNDP